MGVKHIVLPLALLAAGAAVFWMLRAGEAPASPYEYTLATRGAVVREVNVTGTVEPIARVALSFEQGGKVAQIFVDEGKEVRAGDLLARLSDDEAEAAYRANRAALQEAQARRDKVLRGARKEKLSVAEARRASARLQALQAEEEMKEKIAEAFSRAWGEVRENIDQLYEEGPAGSFRFGARIDDNEARYYFTAPRDAALKLNALRDRLAERFTAWQARIAGGEETEDASASARAAEDDLALVRELLIQMSDVILARLALTTDQQMVYDRYKSDLATTLNTVNGLLASVKSARFAFELAQAEVRVAEEEYALTAAPAREEDKTETEAAVERARARLAQVAAQRDARYLFAPRDGVITYRSLEEGEVVAAGTPVMTLAPASRYQLRAFLPEADIVDVRPGQMARVSLDAVEGVVFEARVVTLASQETIRDGVPTYKTILLAETLPPQALPGMSAEITIKAAEARDVIKVPARALREEGGKKYLRILTEDGQVERRPVETGLRGSDGSIEIRKGVREGERVVLFLREEGKK